MKRFVLLSLFSAGAAFAQAKAPAPTATPVTDKAPIIAANHKLNCAGGASQVGGPTSNMQMMGCMKMGSEGQRVFDGPMLSFYKGGLVEAAGQTENGFRSGKWTFYTQAGVKVGETEFKKGDYHGRRVLYFANGDVKAEEFWVEGKRQGPQKAFDESGKVSVVNFLDDRPAAN